MNIDVPMRELGPIAVDGLRETILAQEETAWVETPQGRKNYEVHRQTRSIFLVFCDNNWPQLTVSRKEGWDRLSPAAVPVMDELIGRCYPQDGTIIRAMAARLPGGCRITPHFDAHRTFELSHRVHVPITTNPQVQFTVDGRPYQLQVGQAYELNNQLTHSVLNSGRDDRITFIFDYLPSEATECGQLRNRS